jgi:hypothetical protein
MHGSMVSRRSRSSLETSSARLRAELEAQFKPVEPMEHLLVDRVAGLMWRLRRVPAFEAAVINVYQEREADLGLALIRNAELQDMLGKFSRYEASLMSLLSRTLQLLHSLRQEGKTVEGSVVDIVTLPSPKAFGFVSQRLILPTSLSGGLLAAAEQFSSAELQARLSRGPV